MLGERGDFEKQISDSADIIVLLCLFTTCARSRQQEKGIRDVFEHSCGRRMHLWLRAEAPGQVLNVSVYHTYCFEDVNYF